MAGLVEQFVEVAMTERLQGLEPEVHGIKALDELSHVLQAIDDEAVLLEQTRCIGLARHTNFLDVTVPVQYLGKV